MKTLEDQLSDYGKFRARNHDPITTPELVKDAPFVPVVAVTHRRGLLVAAAVAIVVLVGGISAFLLVAPSGVRPADDPTPPATVVDVSTTSTSSLTTATVPLVSDPTFGKAQKVWTNHFTGHAGSTDQLDWYEPNGVIERTLYVEVCRPSCEEAPSKADMVVERIGYYPGDEYTNPNNFAGSLYRYPNDVPSEVWWLVELRFDPARAECAPILDDDGNCIVDTGPFRITILPREYDADTTNDLSIASAHAGTYQGQDAIDGSTLQLTLHADGSFEATDTYSEVCEATGAPEPWDMRWAGSDGLFSLDGNAPTFIGVADLICNPNSTNPQIAGQVYWHFYFEPRNELLWIRGHVGDESILTLQTTE